MRDLYNYYKPILISKFGLSESSFNEQFNSWTAKHGTSVQSKNDFIYSQFNQLVFDAGKIFNGTKLYEALRPIYFRMWEFLLFEKKSRNHVFKLMLYCDLMMANEASFKIRAHIIGSKCCPECDKSDGITMPLEEAILKQPLPVPSCTKITGCACCYGFIGERDLNDRLIMKQR